MPLQIIHEGFYPPQGRNSGTESLYHSFVVSLLVQVLGAFILIEIPVCIFRYREPVQEIHKPVSIPDLSVAVPLWGGMDTARTQ